MIRQTLRWEDLKSGNVQDPMEGLEKFRKLSVQDMLDNIENTHHLTERDQMEEITALGKELELKELRILNRTFLDLKEHLMDHFDKEEQVVFPLMWIYEHPTAELRTLLNELQNEHRDQERIIRRLTEEMSLLTLSLPKENAENAADTDANVDVTNIRTFLERIQSLLNDISEHIMKEDEVLFPKYEENLYL
ncbi:MAG: hemerythrin domain-containing protein [Oribacterium sp.]|nr:hemerythrin domain-containing protein [Oribacterium sp.]